VNQRCARLLGAASREDLIGKPLVDVLHPSSRDVALEHVRQVVEEKRTTSRLEERMITLDGRAIDVEVSATPLLYERKPSILAVLHDITERKIADQQLAFLAQYDALTGLPNRALFRDRLSLALARAVRKKRPLAVLFVNLDHFKETNDSLGRGAGDEVLLATAALLKDTLSDVDTIARLGGDEFTVILESIDDAHHAAALAERVKQAFANPFQLRGQDIFVTASMGISFHSPEAHDVDALLQTAEIAMYHAKDAGRNGFVFYAPEMNAEAGRRLNMTALLRRALERQELILHYQPKCDTRTGRIVGVEALARIDSDELGLIPAARFIPLAEETGLIFPIGEWALRTACTQVKAWQWRGFPPLTVSVNLSPRQLQQNDLVKTIANVLEQTGLDGHLLELEITEVMAMRNLDEYIERLKAIRRLGVTLAIDDFGTGYSSLAHLAKLPIRALKIDHSFTLAMQENPDAMTLVSTILTLARSLGLKVIAEGVETKEQEKILRLLRCDEIQGYFVSRPLSAEAIPGFLNRNQTRLAHAQQSRETAAIAS
jgi:diguanylate cyclase (GGDEF)-like protein/PAS domain S-box-containing protein